jgi:hypothetical protein
VKKSKAGLPKGHTDEKVDEERKPNRAHTPQRGGDGLTCNEAEMEGILSEGEST